MTEERDGGSVGFDSSPRFGDHGSPLLNRIAKLAASVVPVHSQAEIVASRNVALTSGAYLKARWN